MKVSVRCLKSRGQQNLEYEFKQLKVKASKTGEEGLNKIKEGFPYYSIFDQTLGYRDSVDPAKMEIESSSFMPSALDSHSTKKTHFFRDKGKGGKCCRCHQLGKRGPTFNKRWRETWLQRSAW